MSRFRAKTEQRGFTLIELLTALGIFLLVCGAAFTLLGSSQKHYQTESQVLSSFQEARLGLDQIVRDVNDAGYPPPTFFSANAPQNSASSPFAWSQASGYPNTSCQIATGGGGNCTTATAGDISPGDFDLIIETNPNPRDPLSQVQWIRYQLQGTTLMRGAANKVSPGDPDTTTSGNLVPFVQNVVNTAAQPIFSYTCDTTTTPPPTLPCPNVINAGDNKPANIREVIVTLIVAAPVPDITSGQPRLVQLTGRGRRVNPNQ
jgi:prepilin-type N-terminal cleavage/methylation domain-containing protein